MSALLPFVQNLYPGVSIMTRDRAATLAHAMGWIKHAELKAVTHPPYHLPNGDRDFAPADSTEWRVPTGPR